MTDAIIAVENLGKKYRIRHQANGRYVALRDVIAQKLKAPFRLFKNRRPGGEGQPATSEDFWALSDLSFEINRGDIVGIVGRNGAGKSTLLKILSRITEPTTGRVKLYGKVASLLEVGTGFHAELTGRENIFLNGAILGMSNAEIRKKFDEIVAFAEVEKFLDTPVKHYSSGMYVRLAFAVAAHLEPEILIVDEVLAVGDAGFQKRCLGKMQEVSKGEGRTVLFVSHNMAAVQALCSKAIYLQAGKLNAIGEVNQIVEKYQANAGNERNERLHGPIKIGDSLELIQMEFAPRPIASGDRLRFVIEFHARKSVRIAELAALFYSAHGVRVAMVDFRGYGLPLKLLPGQRCLLTGEIESLPLIEGAYSIGLYANAGLFNADVFDIINLNVEPPNRNTNCAPYAPVHRGFVELNYTAAFQPQDVNRFEGELTLTPDAAKLRN
jgi:lipopolysaccharide transport system ATP-binding protein